MNSLDNIVLNSKVRGLSLPGHKYSVKLAETKEEVESAFRLRFDVFNIELGEGLDSSYHTQMDKDEFDEQCHHLIVTENSTNEVIGTYRMQDNTMAEAGNGFYTQSEFDLNGFDKEVLNNVVELGRACIHRDHRSGRVLYLLWRGLAKYLELADKRFLFGCCSITSQNAAEGEAVYQYLVEKGHMHPKFLVNVQPEFECTSETGDTPFNAEVKLPQLFRLYLDVGSKVCSPPALDRTFKTIDFLILLDKSDLSEQSKALFLR